jgi:hypothetical protein
LETVKKHDTPGFDTSVALVGVFGIEPSYLLDRGEPPI